MKTRAIGPLNVAEIGFGCMSLSHAGSFGIINIAWEMFQKEALP
jgi:hypothetical protein